MSYHLFSLLFKLLEKGVGLGVRGVFKHVSTWFQEMEKGVGLGVRELFKHVSTWFQEIQGNSSFERIKMFNDRNINIVNTTWKENKS